ncbi:MAG: DUF58 domain-containing protein [Planctomycetes bacterium]|nr:DUF58 domain-containing protein [Planctomycetota bacterium]
MTTGNDVFNGNFLRRLEALEAIVKRILLAGTVGERVTRQKGGRIEFAGHRSYTPGDESRYIDWNAFGRTERLYIKEFAREEILPVYLLIDVSDSMGVPAEKEVYLKQLAAAIGYIGLAADAPLRIFAFNSGRRNSSAPLAISRFPDIIKSLNDIPASGRTDIASALVTLEKTARQKGWLVLISDLMEPSHSPPGGEKGWVAIRPETRQCLLRFVRKGFTVNVIHLLSPEEEMPSLSGILRLKDSELAESGSETRPVTKKTLSDYRSELKIFCESWRHFCNHHNIEYFYLTTRKPFEEAVLALLKQGGFLR